MMTRKTLFMLACTVVIAAGVGSMVAFAQGSGGSLRTPPPPDQDYLTASENADLQSVHELMQNILTGTDNNENEIVITDADVRMYIGLMESDQLSRYVRRYALAGAGEIWLESPHITNQHADWLESSLMDIWAEDTCEHLTCPRFMCQSL